MIAHHRPTPSGFDTDLSRMPAKVSRPRPVDPGPATPFGNAEEAWFWVMRSLASDRPSGRAVVRPCRPEDILRVIDRLYRQRCLIRDHLCVLAHYGRRRAAPDPRLRRELRALTLWREAFQSIAPLLHGQGIVTATESPGEPRRTDTVSRWFQEMSEASDRVPAAWA